MQLTDQEKSFLDGSRGKAQQKAMELLVRYAEALGAERFVDTNNVCGVPGSANPFLQNYYKDKGTSEYDAIFSFFDLDSDELIEAPQALVSTCCLQGGADPDNWETLGTKPQVFNIYKDREQFAADHGVKILKTCTPYIVGNTPAKGEHCAWMESSAVVYCNSVLGARTNTEGRESTSAAMLTGKIPDWGFHRDEFRYGIASDRGRDPDRVGDGLGHARLLRRRRRPGAHPCVDRQVRAARSRSTQALRRRCGFVRRSRAVSHRRRHAGSADDRGGIRAERRRSRHSRTVQAERKRTYEAINASAKDPNVDYVMLGCPHAALEQIEEACRLLDGRRISANSALWIFTSRAVKEQAQARGLTDIIAKAGGIVMTDTCSAFAQAIPPGTKVAALDSAKQAHYLPAIMNIQAWFGSTRDCINAAITGRWNPDSL